MVGADAPSGCSGCKTGLLDFASNVTIMAHQSDFCQTLFFP
jgi:hypothetical protein